MLKHIGFAIAATVISTQSFAVATDSDGDTLLEAATYTNAVNYFPMDATDIASMTFWNTADAEAPQGTPSADFNETRQANLVAGGGTTYYFSWATGGGNDILAHYSNGYPGYEAPTSVDPLFAQMPVLPPNPSAAVTITYGGTTYNLLAGDVLALTIDNYQAIDINASWTGVPYPTVAHVTFSQIEPSAVPVPAAAWLFGSAMLGLAGVARKRKAA